MKKNDYLIVLGFILFHLAGIAIIQTFIHTDKNKIILVGKI